MIFKFNKFLNEYLNHEIIDNKKIIGNLLDNNDGKLDVADTKKIDNDILNKLSEYKISIRELLTYERSYTRYRSYGRSPIPSLNDNTIEDIINIWENKFSDINIYYYVFSDKMAGISLNKNSIAINKELFDINDPDILLAFILFHEVGHCYQRKNMVDDNEFLHKIENKDFIINKIEKMEEDASKFSINIIENIEGIDINVIHHLMENEPPIDFVYDQLLKNINKYKPNTMLELFYKQTH